MDRPSRITIDGIEYNLLTDEELGELVFIEKLEAHSQSTSPMPSDMRS